MAVLYNVVVKTILGLYLAAITFGVTENISSSVITALFWLGLLGVGTWLNNNQWRRRLDKFYPGGRC